MSKSKSPQTLEEWCAKYRSHQCNVGTGCKIVVADHGEATQELYGLRDYAVSTRSGIVTYLVPKFPRLAENS